MLPAATTLYTIGNVATSSIPGITFEAHVLDSLHKRGVYGNGIGDD